MRHTLLLLPLLCLPLLGCNSGDVVEERITDTNGTLTACGEGDGLTPCKSFEGAVSNQQLYQEANQIRNESPKQVEESVELLEDTPADEVNQDE